MDKLRHKLWLRIAVLVNFILLTVPFAFCWYGYYINIIKLFYYRRGNILIVLLFAGLFIVFGHTYDAFQISYNRVTEMVYSQGLAILFADVVMYTFISLMSLGFVNVLPLVLAFVVQIGLALLWSWLIKKWYFHAFHATKTTVLYEDEANIEERIWEIRQNRKFEIVQKMPASECIRERMKPIEEMDAVLICGVDSRMRNALLKYCIEKDIQAFVLPRIGDVIMSGAKRMHMFHLPFLYVERCNPPVEYLVFKRVFDLVIAVVGVVVTSPVMLGTAVAIKLNDGGPVFYRQRRLTKDGREFTMLKFRSMRVDAEKEGGARLSTGSADERVTKVGRVIRKVRIDELPQLFNILRGDMSVVGPRPERPEIAAQYMETLPEFKLRLQVKGGLTGYAQVYGKYNTTPYDKLQMDLMYIANSNIIEDLRIVLATIKILFLPESTQGVGEGQKTAANQGEKEGKR